MTPFDFLKLAAACWAISYMVTKTHGPLGIFERLREFKGGRWHGRTIRWIENPMPKSPTYEQVGHDGLLDCIICLSIWVAMALVLIGANVVTDAFAVAGCALWAHSWMGWRMNI